MGKGLLTVLCVAALVAILAGGLSPSTGFAAQSSKPIKIAFSGWTGVRIPYWVAYWKGMRDAAKHFGDVQLVFYDAERDPTKQLNHISDMISRGVSAVAIVTVWPDTLVEGAKLAQKAKVGFITIDVPVNGETLYTGSDMVLGAYRVTKAMIEKLGGSGNIAAIIGTLSDSVSFMRRDGFLKAAKEYPKVKVLDVKPGDYARPKAYQQVEAWIAKYPVIDGIFAASDDMTLGAYEALASAKREKRTVLVGYDAVEEFLQAMSADKVYATVSGDPYLLGWMGVVYGRKYALGEKLPKRHMVHSPLILPANLAAYKSYVAGQMGSKGMTWIDVQKEMAKATIVK